MDQRPVALEQLWIFARAFTSEVWTVCWFAGGLSVDIWAAVAWILIDSWDCKFLDLLVQAALIVPFAPVWINFDLLLLSWNLLSLSNRWNNSLLPHSQILGHIHFRSLAWHKWTCHLFFYALFFDALSLFFQRTGMLDWYPFDSESLHTVWVLVDCVWVLNHTTCAQRLALESLVFHWGSTASLSRWVLVKVLPVRWVCFLNQLQVNAVNLLLRLFLRGSSWNQRSWLGPSNLFGGRSIWFWWNRGWDRGLNSYFVTLKGHKVIWVFFWLHIFSWLELFSIRRNYLVW